MGPAPLTLDEATTRLRARMEKRTERAINGCLEWTGYRNPQTDYGQITVPVALEELLGTRTVTAHVAAAYLAFGYREGMYVLHECDNPPCCDPEHLRWGEPWENMADLAERGPKDMVVLDRETVNSCVRRYESGEASVRELAAETGASERGIYNWLQGVTRQLERGQHRRGPVSEACKEAFLAENGGAS